MGAAARKIAHLAIIATLASCSAKSGKEVDTKPPEGRSFTLFATTEMRGNIEPCGCTSDPMGDLSRTVAMVSKARAGTDTVLFVDAGSTQYKELVIPPHLEEQEKMTSGLLMSTLTERMDVAALGLGPHDLSKGPAAVQPPRHAVNVPASAGIALAPPAIFERGGVKVGVFGVVGQTALTGIQVEDPIATSTKAIEELRGKGAEVVIALAHMTQMEAGALARDAAGIDVVIVGQQSPTDPDKVSDVPRKVKKTWLVQPADRGQTVVRLDITVRDGGGPLSDAIGKARADVEIAAIDKRIPALEKQLAEWSKDPNADPAFIEVKKKELLELAAKRKSLAASPLVTPDNGSWFVMEQVRIRKRLPCDSAVQDQKVALDKRVGEANVKAAANDKPVAPEKGKAGYVGAEECGYCHSEAVEFWKKTRHAKAWETLEKYGKQFSYDCVYCHVTGWKEPGGSTMSVNETLRDIQCEVCHGPGSLHVDADGKEKPASLVREPAAKRCETCHNEDHSDTFDFKPYLRDVTGPGHGESFRKSLGDGPTGRQLRTAALKQAGADIGAGCLK